MNKPIRKVVSHKSINFIAGKAIDMEEVVILYSSRVLLLYNFCHLRLRNLPLLSVCHSRLHYTEVKCSWLWTFNLDIQILDASKQAYTHVQCSSASVELAQAHTNCISFHLKV